MSIKTRFAAYTTEELEERIALVEKRAAETKASMERFKTEQNLESYKTARDLYDRDIEILSDAKYELDVRLGRI